MPAANRTVWQSAAAIAAALFVVAGAFALSGESHAQQNPQDPRAQRKQQQPPAKGPAQQMRKGPMGNAVVGPNRMGPRGLMPGAPGPRGQMLGPGGPQGQQPGAGMQPNMRGPGLANRDPRANELNKGPNARAGHQPPGQGRFGNQPGNQGRFGNQPGNQGRFANQPGNQGRFGNQPGSQGRFGNQGRFGQPRGFTNRDPRLRAVNAATPQMRQTQRFTHRSDMLAFRARLPTFPLPGERNFTGIPPVAETRFVTTEMVCQWGPDFTQAQIEEIARQHNLVIVGIQRSVLTGSTLVHFRIGGNRAARDVVRAMEAERIVSQPNYIYEAVQAAEPAAADSASGGGEQYVANKLRLAEVHKIATGKGVTVAVIDSAIDAAHPEFKQAIADKFDAVGKPDKPHTHGTGMAGAIVAQSRLMGVAPGARTLAVHAFSTSTQQSPQATTQAIIAGLEWALNKGARVINMSFAGPYDPMLALAMKKASEKGAVLIAAVGNAGPKSPPLYPAADPRVIGVTAVDENDQLYKGANVGAQVAVAAPGVDVMVPAPADAYQLTTGTSVAAAHVSGVAALLLEKHPGADAQTILEVLTSSATRLGNKRDDKLGWGLVDPLAALAELDHRVTDLKVAAPATAPSPAPVQAAVPARPATAATPAAAAPASAGTTRSTLPRPGIYAPKQ
jgi:subtilisin family serine protease